MKKILCIFVVILLVLGTMASCAPAATQQSAAQSSAAPAPSSAAPAQSAAPSSAAAPASQAASSNVTLRMMWWGGDARHKATLAMIDLYKQKTGVTVQAEYQGWEGYEEKLMTQLASNTAPDIIQIDSPWLLDFAKKALFVNLKGNPSIDLSQFDQEFLDKYCTVNGILSGLPCGVNAFRFVASKKFLEANGVDASKTYTWDEFFELGKKIHDANKDNYLMAWDVSEGWAFFENYIRNKTGDFIIGDDYTVHASKDQIIESLTMLKKMYDTNTSLPMSEVQPFASAMDTSPKWINGQIGGLPDYTSKITTWQASIQTPIVTMNVPIPTGAKVTGDTYRPAMLWGVPKCSKNQEEALKFLQWALTDPEAAKLLGTVRSVPAAKSSFDTLKAANQLDPVLVDALEKGAADKAPPAPYVLGDQEVYQILNDTFQKVVLGQSTVEAAADEVTQRLQTRLNEMKG